MNKKDLLKIRNTAARVRRLLLKKLGIDRACSRHAGTAAIPLAAELRAKGFPEAIVVYGKVITDKPYMQCEHYWVELDSLIIDITGDQFNAILDGQKIPEVLIAPYELMPRYKPSKKDAIKFSDDTENFLIEWLEVESK